MSSDPRFILEVIPRGTGLILDLGGGQGMLRQPLQERGYSYINIDICQFENGEPTLIADVHALPFRDCSFDIVVSKDTLEHFLQPWDVVKEVHWVLKNGGQFIIYVPFMHPFHGNDFYRYSPLGLRNLLKDFEIITLESPLWVFTVVSPLVTEALRRMHLGFLQAPTKHLCGWLDRLFMRRRKAPAGFAPAYRIVARKPEGSKQKEML